MDRNESKRKSNKLWVDRGRELYNELMLEWLDDNEGKSVVIAT